MLFLALASHQRFMADGWKIVESEVTDMVAYCFLLRYSLFLILRRSLDPTHSFSNQSFTEMRSSRQLLAQIFSTALCVTASPISPELSATISKIPFNVDFSNLMASPPIHDHKRAIALTSVFDKRDFPIEDVSIQAVNDLVYFHHLFI